MDLINEIQFKIPIREILLEDGLMGRASELCAELGNLHVICDKNTEEFTYGLKAPKTILSGDQKAELQIAANISKISCDCFVAFGSGTVNDITKYAAHLAGKPYIVFATAPSMNGYASANASLIHNGHKKSYAATAPLAIYLDTEILAHAPRRLINAGIGDSICRSTVQADNLLAHKVIGANYHHDFFELMKAEEEKIFEDITALAKILIYGGIAMLLAKSSEPASQGEHMLAHYMELMQPSAPHSFHGEQISVTTIAMAKIQADIIDNDSEFEVSISPIDEEKIISHFGAENGAVFIAESNAKYSKAELGKISSAEFRNLALNSEKLEKALAAIGAPTKPSELGWDEAIFQDALQFAKYTRNRFTFLDIV